MDDRPDYLRDGDDPGYVIAIDTETTGLNWFDGDYAFLATISDYDRDYLYRLEGEDAEQDEKQLREDILKADVLIFHNAAFDINVLISSGIVSWDEIMVKRIEDTDIYARCVLGADHPSFNLKELATEFVDLAAGDAEQKVKEAMVSLNLIRRADQRTLPNGAHYKTWQAYPDLVERYAIKDTRYTYDLFFVLREKADEDHQRVYEEIEREVLPTMVQMEHKGVSINHHKVTELHSLYSEKEVELSDKIYELNGYEEINLNSNAQVAQMLMRRGVQLTRTTRTGEIAVAQWALEPFKGEEAVDAILDYTTTHKFNATYIDPMRSRSVVHPNFMQIGARTGRMACRRPNMQNIPVRSGPEVREMFVPRTGMVFVVADYSSIELRLLAYYMNDDGLWKIIEEGDPFLWLGEQVYGTPDQEQWKVKRDPLKNGFYALTYGAGGPKLAATIGGGMTPDEGRLLSRRIKQALGPNFRHLNSRIRQQIETHGAIKTIGRRTQYVPRDRSYVGLNALIQGSAADIMKWGLINAAESLATVDGYPLLVVHDEIVAEVPAERAEEALGLLRAAMANATDLLPLKVDGKICVNNYGEGK